MRRYYSYFRGIILSILAFTVVGILRLYGDTTDTFLEVLKEEIIFVVFITMIIIWAISVRTRIMHKTIRDLLFGIAAIMIFWVLVREVKWHFAEKVDVERFLWYCYYIPMIEMPLLSFLAALKVGKPEDRLTRKYTVPLFLVSALLSGLALTNDFHGWMFRLEDLQDLEHYSYGPGFFLVILWMLGFGLSTILIIIYKNAVEQIGMIRFLPLLFVVLGVAYGILYAKDSSSFGVGFVEIMAMYDWDTVMIWETCIALGMIPINSQYKEFFEKSTICAQIVDRKGRTRIAAGNALPLERHVYESLKENGTVTIDGHTVLQYHPISCGALIWQQDMEDIQNLVTKLQNDQQELREKNALEDEAMKARIRENLIEEKNRLYTLISNEMEPGIETILERARQLKESKDLDVSRQFLARVNMLGTYIKRRSNFIILSEDDKLVPMEEIAFCLGETQRNLAYCGLQFSYRLYMEAGLARKCLLEFYDTIEGELKRDAFRVKQLQLVAEEFDDYYLLTFSVPKETEKIYRVGRERIRYE